MPHLVLPEDRRSKMQTAPREHVTFDAVALQKDWEALWQRVGVGPQIALLHSVRQAYLKPARHYHNLAHIAACVEEFKPVRKVCENPDAVEAAIWFHDWVYDPMRADNEQRSAEQAMEAITEAGGPPAMAYLVGRYVLETTHDNTPPIDQDAQVLVDIDLSILGKPQPEYDHYERMIRREYTHVPESRYRTARAAILRRFLARPRIYHNAHFITRYEQPARENLARSIAKLETL